MNSGSAELKRKAIGRSYQWREFRREFLYSQGELAEALGISKRTVAAIEAGIILHPRPLTLRKFRDLRRTVLRREATYQAQAREYMQATG